VRDLSAEGDALSTGHGRSEGDDALARGDSKGSDAEGVLAAFIGGQGIGEGTDGVPALARLDERDGGTESIAGQGAGESADEEGGVAGEGGEEGASRFDEGVAIRGDERQGLPTGTRDWQGTV
jgi:hypothetical protein